MDPAPPAVVAALSRRAPSAGTRRASARPTCGRRPAGGSPGASTWTSIRPRSPPASAPRSSSARCRSGFGCAGPTATRSCTRRSSYPTYEMGAILAGCRAVAVPLDPAGRLALDEIAPEDAGRALALWVNSPGNPTGALDDLGAAAALGPRPRRAGVLRRVLRRVHVGRARPQRSSSTAPTAWSPCTRCRSAPTWPAPGSASTPAMPTSCSTCSRCASTSG